MQRKNTITTKDKLKKRRKESLWDQGSRELVVDHKWRTRRPYTPPQKSVCFSDRL